MSAIEAVARAPEHPWRAEIRAMLQLSWPMVLTNLGQTAMTATDVLMMGRLGPDALAAVSLGANLYFMPLIFGVLFFAFPSGLAVYVFVNVLLSIGQQWLINRSNPASMGTGPNDRTAAVG